MFSAASGRGLIEAVPYGTAAAWVAAFSAASGRGLIEAPATAEIVLSAPDVFRGIGPRPH